MALQRQIPGVVLALATVLATAGCSSLEQQDRTDRGFELAKEGREAEKAADCDTAQARYREAEEELVAALAIAEERADSVAQRLIHMKLNHVRMGRGRCLEEAGEWEAARSAYASATEDALAGRFLKLAKEGYLAQAGTVRPDRNRQGDWPQAAALYGEAVEVTGDYEDPKGRAEALFAQAVALSGGDREGVTGEARALLREARDLGHPEAEEWLGAAGGCLSCAAELPDGAAFCPSCGAKVGEAACPSCGAELTPGANFCPSCGAKLRQQGH